MCVEGSEKSENGKQGREQKRSSDVGIPKVKKGGQIKTDQVLRERSCVSTPVGESPP